MKKLLIKFALWILKKCSYEQLLDLSSCFNFYGSNYRVKHITYHFEDGNSNMTIEAEEIEQGGKNDPK